MLKFITGNKGKFSEISSALEPIKVKRVDIDLEEIQELDPRKVIKHKLAQAFKHESGGFIIEDTSTYYGGFKNKLPGTLMKWFLHVLEPEGLYQLAKKLGNNKAEMRTIIAYAKNKKQVYFFEGMCRGVIVKPRIMGTKGFGVDPIFKPNGSNKTLSELKNLGILKFSARNKAVLKFKRHLLKYESYK